MERLPTKLDPSQVVAIRDTREQVGVDLSPLQVKEGTLSTGDYSLLGLENQVAVELKGSLEDLLACVGRERHRFDREIQRLRGYPVRALILCTTWRDVEAGQWRGKVTPRQVEAAILGWMATGVPTLLVGDRQRAGRIVSRYLYTAARRHYREARQFLQTTSSSGCSIEGGIIR